MPDSIMQSQNSHMQSAIGYLTSRSVVLGALSNRERLHISDSNHYYATINIIANKFKTLLKQASSLRRLFTFKHV